MMLLIALAVLNALQLNLAHPVPDSRTVAKAPRLAAQAGIRTVRNGEEAESRTVSNAPGAESSIVSTAGQTTEADSSTVDSAARSKIAGPWTILTLHEVKQLLKRSASNYRLQPSAGPKLSRRRQRGLRHQGDRRLKCLHKNRRGRCTRYAMIGMWFGMRRPN